MRRTPPPANTTAPLRRRSRVPSPESSTHAGRCPAARQRLGVGEQVDAFAMPVVVPVGTSQSRENLGN